MIISFFFIVYLTFYFLRFHEYSYVTADTSLLALLLGACMVLYLFHKEKNLKVIQLPFIVGFFVWACVSHISFFYLEGTITTADKLIRLVIFYLIAAALFVDKDRLELYLKFICMCALIMAIHGFYQIYNGGVGWSGQPLSQGTRIRYVGVFSDPNDLGMLLLMSIPFYFYFLTKSNFIFSKILWLLLVVVLIYAIYLTNSRGTLLTLFALFGFYGWHKYSRTLVLTGIAITVPAVFAVTRLSTISTSESSARERISAWTEGFYMLRSDPIFGVGYDLFRDHHHLVAHSSYVQSFAETGLIGYFFWLGLLSMSIYPLYKFVYKYSPENSSNLKHGDDLLLQQKKIANTVMYSLIAYAGCAFFISRGDQPLFFLACGMSAGVLTQINKNFPDHQMVSFKEGRRITIYILIVSILVIYASIRIFW